MSRPRLLDLFCGAGGAAVGYHWAGFDVVGVDIVEQKNYPFEFMRADALEFLDQVVSQRSTAFDAIHASPPCHDHSNVTGRNRRAAGPKGTAWMLAATVERLAAQDRPWVVENVETADFPGRFYRVRLCGSSFGLDVRRHRWFASDVALMAPACAHHLQRPRFRSLDSRQKSPASVIGVHGHLNYAGEAELRKAAMGIPWMTVDELSQAIPPAYTTFIGEQLLSWLHAEHGLPLGSSPARTPDTDACPDLGTDSPPSTGGPAGSASCGHSGLAGCAATAVSSPQSERGRDALD